MSNLYQGSPHIVLLVGAIVGASAGILLGFATLNEIFRDLGVWTWVTERRADAFVWGSLGAIVGAGTAFIVLSILSRPKS